MKFYKSILLMSVFTLVLFACKKNIGMSELSQGTFLTTASAGLTASSTTLVLDSTSAATKTGITFNWPTVNYGTPVTVTYTLQIDSVNGNFAKPVTVDLATKLTKSYTVAELNAMATSLGLVPTVSGKIRARVKAEVNQSNGVASSIPTVYSNVLDLTITPYSTKPVPKYPVPDSLYIVGDATPGGWNNPVPMPSQKLTKIDDNTYGIVIQLTGGKFYDFLPKNGDWSHKYSVTTQLDPTTGTFVPDAAKDIPGPVASGLYTIVVDFVKATYTVTPGNTFGVPSNLYIVGDATAGQWNNPVPVPSQQFTQTSSGEFNIAVPLATGKSYLFLPLNGDWTHKYGGTGKTGGALLLDSAVPGTNTPAPDASGTYKISVNFFSKQYKVTP